MGWIPFHLSSSLLLVLTNLQPFLLPSTFTILCLSKLPPTSDSIVPYSVDSYSNAVIVFCQKVSRDYTIVQQ